MNVLSHQIYPRSNGIYTFYQDEVISCNVMDGNYSRILCISNTNYSIKIIITRNYTLFSRYYISLLMILSINMVPILIDQTKISSLCSSSI